jgi:chemotaxis protein MotB
MSRRDQGEHDEAPNHERWLVSYADFVTLLFAFFVVMYAISSVNEGRYRVLSNSLSDAFSGFKAPATSNRLNMITPPIPNLPMPHRLEPHDPGRAEREKLQSIAQKLQSSLRGLIESDQVHVIGGAHSVSVDIKASVLFVTGQANLQPQAMPVLDEVERSLVMIDEPVQVEGHTDNVPISTPQFPSNWELSAARAGSVVRHFVDLGMPPARLAAAGYGEFRPIDTNDTPEGRSRNRRVTLVIMPNADTAPAENGTR